MPGEHVTASAHTLKTLCYLRAHYDKQFGRATPMPTVINDDTLPQPTTAIALQTLSKEMTAINSNRDPEATGQEIEPHLRSTLARLDAPAADALTEIPEIPEIPVVAPLPEPGDTHLIGGNIAQARLPPLLFADVGPSTYTLDLTVAGTTLAGQIFSVKLNPILATVQAVREQSVTMQIIPSAHATPAADEVDGVTLNWLYAGAANLALLLVAGVLFRVVIMGRTRRLQRALEASQAT